MAARLPGPIATRHPPLCEGPGRGVNSTHIGLQENEKPGMREETTPEDMERRYTACQVVVYIGDDVSASTRVSHYHLGDEFTDTIAKCRSAWRGRSSVSARRGRSPNRPLSHGDHVNAVLLVAIGAGHLPAMLAIERVGLAVAAETLELQGIVLPEEVLLEPRQQESAQALAMIALVDHELIDVVTSADSVPATLSSNVTTNARPMVWRTNPSTAPVPIKASTAVSPRKPG